MTIETTRAWIVATAGRTFTAIAITVPSFMSMAITAMLVMAMALAAPSPATGASLEETEVADEDGDDERAGIDSIPCIDPGPAVREYLARLHAEDWSRFDLLEARWSEGEPVVGTVIGPISGAGAPTANGSLTLYADIERGGGPPARLPISVTVRPWVNAPIAVRDLGRGEFVAAADVRLEERPLLELRRGALDGVAMVGAPPRSRLRARKVIRAGEVLTSSAVEERPPSPRATA
jgi:hypothetical protein